MQIYFCINANFEFEVIASFLSDDKLIATLENDFQVKTLAYQEVSVEDINDEDLEDVELE